MDPAGSRRLLAQLGVRPRKGIGQHFLTDSRVATRHVAYARVTSADVVLEIGPGLGILTRPLVERARRVIAIEKDPKLAAYLRRELPEVELLEGDALEVPWPAFDVMASNLPFQISSPLTFRLLEHPFDRAVLMYQREFAKRLVATPRSKDYSRLSVNVYRHAACTVLERVPRSAFLPQPRVDASLVRLEPRPVPFPISDPARFDAVAHALFEHRRKTVENSLRLAWQSFANSPEAFEAIVPSLPFRGRRVEELRPEDIAILADALDQAKD